MLEMAGCCLVMAGKGEVREGLTVVDPSLCFIVKWGGVGFGNLGLGNVFGPGLVGFGFDFG